MLIVLNYIKNTRQAFASLEWVRALWIRPEVHYPSLHYRYSYDIANVLELRTVGAYAESGKVLWKKSRIALAAMVGSAPLWLAIVLSLTGLSRPPRHLAFAYFGWLTYFFFLTLFEVGLAWAGVCIFHNLTGSLERLLTKKGLDVYCRWANFATAPAPQMVFAIAFSAVACTTLWIAVSVHGMDNRLYVAAPSYLAIAITGYFISQGAYWVVMGTILSVSLTRPGCMKASWSIPAYTPGIELLARCYRLAFYGASIGVALCLFPLLTWVYKGPSSNALLVIKVGLFVGSVAAALLIAVIPQWRLSMIVSQQRRQTIERLESLLPSSAAKAVSSEPTDQTVLAWLQLVTTSPSTTVQNSTIAGMLLGLATAILPYIIRLVV